MKLGDGQLSPFIGYLPAVTDGVLLELVKMSYKDCPPRRGRSGAELSQELAMDRVRVAFKDKPHRRIIQIVANALRDDDAGQYFEMALDVCGEIRTTSPAAAIPGTSS